MVTVHNKILNPDEGIGIRVFDFSSIDISHCWYASRLARILTKEDSGMSTTPVLRFDEVIMLIFLVLRWCRISSAMPNCSKLHLCLQFSSWYLRNDLVPFALQCTVCGRFDWANRYSWSQESTLWHRPWTSHAKRLLSFELLWYFERGSLRHIRLLKDRTGKWQQYDQRKGNIWLFVDDSSLYAQCRNQQISF